MIKRVHIVNYKIFSDFWLDLHDGLNIIVGNNEAGKSTILEAIGLALTRRLNGKNIDFELSPYLFNQDVSKAYIQALRDKMNPVPPKIIVELYLEDKPELRTLKGTINTQKVNEIGLKLEIVFNTDFNKEYEHLLESPDEVNMIPIEYYTVNWYSFADDAITPRSLPIGVSYIDATTIKLKSGTDYYLQNIINGELDPKERAALSVTYRGLKEKFAREKSILGINGKLTAKKGAITDKDLAIAVDVSQKSNWETNLVPHLDELPFYLAGQGEQNALKIMLALERKAEAVQVILLEEPENHLSFSSMNTLVNKIKEKCAGKQIIVTTHSAYVLNKLGLDKLILLHGSQNTATLSALPADTQDYFRKLSGYDTLRLVLASKTILVEGPSDELIVQKAYMLAHKCLPIERGVDVLNVRGLSFERFLDIAKELKNEVVVVTDNDGDYKRKVIEKYEPFADVKTITICADQDESAVTLEPQMLKINGLEALNDIFDTSYATDNLMLKYMTGHKTEWALAVFETTKEVKIPEYVQRAVA